MPPTDLLALLQGVRRRVRVLTLLYGIGVVLAAAVGSLLATITLDYLLDLPAIPRLVVIIASATVVGWSAARFIFRPALSRLNLSDVAGRIETTFPVFDDRLRSTIDFLSKGES